MLYHLFNFLKDYDFPGHGLMTYLSFRAIAAVVISMLFAFFCGGAIIKKLQKAQIGETIRDLGLEGQMQKKGTPTMGGVIIILSLLIAALVINLTIIMVVQAQGYQNMPGNNHTMLRDAEIKRGSISTADDVILAESIENDD